MIFQFAKLLIDIEMLRKIPKMSETNVNQTYEACCQTDFWRPKCQLSHFIPAKNVPMDPSGSDLIATITKFLENVKQ
jgi:hypothetical protein